MTPPALARAALVLVLLAAGCAKALPETPPPVPVRGKVVLPGHQPLRGGIIVFHPTGDTPDRRYMGQAFPRPDGSFEVTTLRQGDGVAPGRYTVTIGPREEGEPKGSNAHRVPKKYRSEETTPLRVEIRPEGNTLQPFLLL